ncbi:MULTISPECIES: DUF1120 domain-containing protein [Pseudomonas]|uniref:DUF1120 domain-containing protein n=1 Tax=Pseudomonas fluorescens TaxID=294 RepID=A0A854X4Q2_PSEFL|nr:MULTISPECIES: hypothetical protein [Pseudomonas]MBB6155135.1 hypothetical protein [Pseudomonas sp. JAI115]PCM49210.1 hypothetical protein CP335_12780 [Pseudomonas fluorescens]
MTELLRMHRWIVLITLASLASTSVMASEACQMTLSPSTVDYGVSTRAELLARPLGNDGSFGVRTVHLRIQCPAARAIRWNFAAPSSDALHYRWAPGRLQIRIVAARLDGAPVQWQRDDGEAGLLQPGDRITAWRAGSIAAGRHLEVELEIEARVSDASSRVADLQRFEGFGTFQLE